jgi:hypothetical protein
MVVMARLQPETEGRGGSGGKGWRPEEREDREGLNAFAFASAVEERIFCVAKAATVCGAKQQMPLSFCIALLKSVYMGVFGSLLQNLSLHPLG